MSKITFFSNAELIKNGAEFCEDIGHQIATAGVSERTASGLCNPETLEDEGYRVIVGRLISDLLSVPGVLSPYAVYDRRAKSEEVDDGHQRHFDSRLLHVTAAMLQLAGLQRLGFMHGQHAHSTENVLIVALNHDAEASSMATYERLLLPSAMQVRQANGSMTLRGMISDHYNRQKRHDDRIVRIQHETAILSLLSSGLIAVGSDEFMASTKIIAQQLQGYEEHHSIWLSIFEELRVKAAMHALGQSESEARKFLSDGNRVSQFKIHSSHRVA